MRTDVAHWVRGEAEECPPVDAHDAPGLARQRAHLARQKAELKATLNAECEALQLWHDSEVRRLNSEAARIDAALLGLLHQQREATGRKTLQLPYGVTVSSRRVPATYRYDRNFATEQSLIATVGESSDYVERKLRVRWEAVKADLHTTSDGHVCFLGEILSPECGVTYEPAHESQTVKVEGDAS